jgi:hypothetical protein
MLRPNDQCGRTTVDPITLPSGVCVAVTERRRRQNGHLREQVRADYVEPALLA